MKVLGFAVVGGVGFLVDGGILTLLSQVAHTNIYLARGASFSLATLATWLLNRTFVFQAEPRFGRRRGIEYAILISRRNESEGRRVPMQKPGRSGRRPRLSEALKRVPGGGTSSPPALNGAALPQMRRSWAAG